MALNPRTPVIVGVGQVTNRPDPAVAAVDRPDPIELMARALEAAAEDCTGTSAGAPAGAGRRLLEGLSSLRTLGSYGSPLVNPALLVAARLAIEPAATVLTGTGGNTPQSLVHDSALAIARGDLDTVAIVGAECGYTRALQRRDPEQAPLDWPTQPATTPLPEIFSPDRMPNTDHELAHGLYLPIQVYPILDVAHRHAQGWSPEEHRRRIGALWSGFSEVAAAHPAAWFRQARTADDIMTARPDNRMISFPYPKLCTANMAVDMAAGFLLCSVEAARSAGVPEDRWIFPLSGAEATDHWFLSERPELYRSPPIRLAGARALSLAGVGLDDVDLVDLYSCFPSVVQIAARELGLAVDDPGRPLTVTGGLTFFGGPGNNFVTHSIATTVQRLREGPGEVGLVTGLGWYATKHAVGLYGTRPPEHEGRDGFRWADVQAEVDVLPRCVTDPEARGPVTIETYTVRYERDGTPGHGIVACRTPNGTRVWADAHDPGDLAELVATEGCGRPGVVDDEGKFHLA